MTGIDRSDFSRDVLENLVSLACLWKIYGISITLESEQIQYNHRIFLHKKVSNDFN
jgi:hypothetical protein